MKLRMLKDVLVSGTGSVQMAVLYERRHAHEADSGSIEYIVKRYSEAEVLRIAAINNKLVITTWEV